jgi:hypothetical protein
MASVKSNADQVAAWIDRTIDGFSFELPGTDQSLGRDIAGIVAEGMIERAVPGTKAPDGGTWPRNEPKYAAWKRKKFGADQVGILTGQMLSLASMMGQVNVTADRVEMTYGTGETPTRSQSGAALTPGEKAATDRQKAEWFTAGGRAFYGLDANIAAQVITHAGERFDEYIAKKGG